MLFKYISITICNFFRSYSSFLFFLILITTYATAKLYMQKKLYRSQTTTNDFFFCFFFNYYYYCYSYHCHYQFRNNNFARPSSSVYKYIYIFKNEKRTCNGSASIFHLLTLFCTTQKILYYVHYFERAYHLLKKSLT